MPKHESTLSGYGFDPLDPMARFPVSFDVSLSSYGMYWCFKPNPGAQFIYSLYELLDRSAFDYKVFSGNAPDVFGSYVPFGWQSFYVWFIASMDVDVDYTLNNINPYQIYMNTRQHLVPLSVNGFRVRNNVPGSNTPYQLVVWR